MISLFLRKKGQGLGVLGLMLGAWFSWGAEASAKPIQQQGLRLELLGVGEWLPGPKLRTVSGVGIGLGYRMFSLGVEGQVARLALRDELSGRYEQGTYPLGVPLKLTIQRDLSGRPLRLGASLGVGWLLGPKFNYDDATFGSFYSWQLFGRVFAHYVYKNWALGPHLGVAGYRSKKEVTSENDIFYEGEAPGRTKYPEHLPVTFHVGLQAVLNFQL